jgi:hypothetical protein
MVCPACLTEEGGKRSVLVEVQRSDMGCGGEANGFKGPATTRDGETMLVAHPGRKAHELTRATMRNGSQEREP